MFLFIFYFLFLIGCRGLLIRIRESFVYSLEFKKEENANKNSLKLNCTWDLNLLNVRHKGRITAYSKVKSSWVSLKELLMNAGVLSNWELIMYSISENFQLPHYQSFSDTENLLLEKSLWKVLVDMGGSSSLSSKLSGYLWWGTKLHGIFCQLYNHHSSACTLAPHLMFATHRGPLIFWSIEGWSDKSLDSDFG